MLPELSLELTLEQQLQMRLIEDQIAEMPVQQMQELLLQSARLLMVKDNIIRALMKGNAILMNEFENPM